MFGIIIEVLVIIGEYFLAVSREYSVSLSSLCDTLGDKMFKP